MKNNFENRKHDIKPALCVLTALMMSACGGGGGSNGGSDGGGIDAPPAAGGGSNSPQPRPNPEPAPLPAPSPAPQEAGSAITVNTTAQRNTRYDVTATTGTVSLTLPQFIVPGDFVSIRGMAGSHWKLIPNPSPGTTARSDFTPQAIFTANLPGNVAPGSAWRGQSVAVTPPVIASNPSGELLISAAMGELRVSTDAGTTWSLVNGVPAGQNWVSAVARTPPFPMIISVPETLLAAASGGGLYKSEQGRAWTQLTSDNPGVDLASRDWRAVTADEGALTIAAAVFNGPIYRYNAGQQPRWQAATLVGSNTPLERPWRALASSLVNGVMAASTNGGEVFVSTTGGRTWELRTVRVGGGTVTATQWSQIAVSNDGGTIAVAGERFAQMYISRDRGLTWAQAATPMGDYTAIAMSADASVIVASLRDTGPTGFGSVQISRDGGASFARLMTMPEGKSDWRAFAMSSDGNQYVAAAAGTIYTSLGNRTSIGLRGSIEGGANDFVEVEYLGKARFKIRSFQGGPFTIR